ncbi:MAG: hypothetical protein IJX14_03540, partial [Clostridia bacterium]|nr:hypothetical protein [Clostridia bacterium]
RTYMNAKKILAVLLAALMTSAGLVACGDGSAETTAETAGENAAGETEAANGETTREQIEDNLPDKDYEGRNFHILTREGYGDDFKPEEMTGEAVNDALYSRNAQVMERYNITVSYDDPACVWGDVATQWNNSLVASVMAGDGAYDLVAGYAATISGVIPQNILLNWNNIPYIDTTRPWWSEQVSDALTVKGNMYVLTGDYYISLWENLFGFFFNKQVAEDYQIEDLYQLTRDGKWTMDKLEEFCSIVSNDSNGDGTWDENDTYGLVTNWSTGIDTFQIGFKMDLVSHTDDGGLEITMMSERAVDIVNRVVALFHDSHGMFTMSTTGEDLSPFDDMFTSNRALFYAIFFANNTALRDMETDFGILPYPKLDESQESYYNTSRDNFDLFVVPVDVKDQEFTGIITEAMCAESYRSVVPTYYDVVLKTKNARDEESAEMIDLIRDTLTFDFGYLCSSSLNGLGHIFVGMVRDGNTDLASKYAAAESAAQTKLQEMLAAYGYNG